MKFTDCINNVSTLIDLKRLANKYVFDYRRLPFDDLKQAMITTAPQYYNKDNVNAVIDTDLRSNPNPDIRTLYRVILKQVLLNKDGFSAPQKDLEDEVISYEQSVLDKENEDETFFSREDISLLSFVVNAAWENNSQISIDEENLILKIKEKLAITDEDYELVLVPWEEERGNGIRGKWQGQKNVAIVIGPEGGISPEEMAQMQAAGAVPVTLGPRIFRTETAGLAAAIALLTLSGDME